MYLLDYHMHTTNSFDGKSTIEEMCKKSIELKFDEICFTEHYSVDPRDVSYDVLNYQKYFGEIKEVQNKYKSNIKIKFGLEVGEPHLKRYKDILTSNLNNYKLDFIIGSIHNVNGIKIRNFMENKEKRKIYQKYFEEVYNMVKVADIDVVGHLDLVKRYAYKTHGNYNFKDYKYIITEILKVIILRNIGIEVNLSGLRDSVNEFYPKQEILEFYKSLGGQIIIIGSDSHSTKNLSLENKKVLLLLKNIGFRHINAYEKRKVKKINL